MVLKGNGGGQRRTYSKGLGTLEPWDFHSRGIWEWAFQVKTEMRALLSFIWGQWASLAPVP